MQKCIYECVYGTLSPLDKQIYRYHIECANMSKAIAIICITPLIQMTKVQGLANTTLGN